MIIATNIVSVSHDLSFTVYCMYTFLSQHLCSKDYTDKDKTRAMRQATSMYIMSIIDNKDIELKLGKFFSRFFKDIDEAAMRLPVFLQVRRCMSVVLTNYLTL